MDCTRARVFMCPEMDDELPVTDSAILQEHLSVCQSCFSEWESLMLVDQRIRLLSKQIVVPDGLADRLLVSIKTEDRRHKVKQMKRFGGFTVGVSIAASLLVFFFAPSFDRQHDDDGVLLVAETADGSPRKTDKTFSRSNAFASSELTKASSAAGFKATAMNFSSFRMAGIEIYTNKIGKKIIRTCYQSPGEKYCIDCYQAPKGVLCLHSVKTVSQRGLLFQLAAVGKHNIVMHTDKGVDYMYASALNKERLLALVAEAS